MSPPAVNVSPAPVEDDEADGVVSVELLEDRA